MNNKKNTSKKSFSYFRRRAIKVEAITEAQESFCRLFIFFVVVVGGGGGGAQ